MDGETATLLISSAPLGWPDITVERRFLAQSVEIEQPAGRPDHRIIIWDEPVACPTRIGGALFRLDGNARSMVVIPAGAALSARPQGPVKFSKIVLRPAFVAAVSAGLGGSPRPDIRPFAGPADTTFAGIAHILIEVVTGHQSLDLEMIAGTARAAAIRLLHGFSDQRFARPETAGRLPVGPLARVLDLIARRLGGPLTVNDMAREAGLSRSHFTRAFAATVGRPPHRYLLARRVSRALYLLKATEKPLDDIAADCGFHDQSHMARSIRAATGRSPRAHRRDPGPPVP